MKAFLSHSSKDKHIVEAVADKIGLANAIIDSRSFEYGVDNMRAIVDQIERTDLFVLFLSRNALLSKYVEQEAVLANRLLQAGHMDKFLTICLDATALDDAKRFIKRFNAVRKISSPNAIARRICAELIALETQNNRNRHVFIGRDSEISDLQDQLIDPSVSPCTAVFISGITGIGRRSFSQQVFSRVYPQVNPLFPTVLVEDNDGYEELYRKLIAINTPFSALSDTTGIFEEFSRLDADGRTDRVGALIRETAEQREAVILLDAGGLLSSDGGLNPVVLALTKAAPTTHHPSLVCISQRSIPARFRGDLRHIRFSSIRALPDPDCRKIIGFLFKQNGIPYTGDQLDDLVGLTDGHPHNIHMVVDFCRQYGTEAFINDPSDLVSWKHRRGYEFIQQFDFSSVDRLILSLLADFPRLESGMLFDALTAPAADIGAALRRLIDLNIVDVVEGDYMLSPPMRVAVERDERFRVDGKEKSSAVRSIAQTFVALEPNDPVNSSLIESGTLAALYTGDTLPPLVVALTLPSQQVWLAQRLYDRRDFAGALSKSEIALKGQGRLSHDGLVEALRIACLAASRLGEDTKFDRFIRVLADASKTNKDRGSVEFLRGFHARMSGDYPDAESHFRSAYDLNLRSYSVLRELAALLVSSGRYEEGEKYARQAYDIAPDNPFVVDILVGCLIGKGSSTSVDGNREIEVLIDRLSQIEDDDMSFSDIRKSEIALYQGNTELAIKLVRSAIKKTGWMYSAHALLADIELKRKNFSSAADALKAMQAILDDPRNMERKSGLRSLLELKIRYLVAVGDHDAARNAYRSTAFSEAERNQGLREIDFEKARPR